MPPQRHATDPQFTYTFVGSMYAPVLPASPELVARVQEREVANRSANAAADRGRSPVDRAWSRVLRELVDGGHLDEKAYFTGSWTSGGTRPLRCPFVADGEHSQEEERSSAYLITRDGAGLRCHKDEHDLSVKEFLLKIGFADTETKVFAQLRKVGLRPPGTVVESDKPKLCVQDVDIHDLMAASWRHLAEQDDADPRLFLRADSVVRVELASQSDQSNPNGKSKAPILVKPLTSHALAAELYARIAYYKNTQEGEKPAALPRDVPAIMLAQPFSSIPRPELVATVDIPVFRRDGTLLTDPGFDVATGLYFAPAAGYRVPSIPESPTDAEIGAAREFLYELVCDFPFVDRARNSDRANAIALAVLPSSRELITGSTPLHVFTATAARTGKGKLARALLNIGRPYVESTAWPSHKGGTDEQELEKRLLSFLRQSTPALIWDNVEGYVESASFAMALTEPRYMGRVLGFSATPAFDVRTIWALTSNNAQLHNDLVKRSVPIRLDAGVEDPERRTGFRHRDLEKFVRTANTELLAAVLTLVRAWLVRGRPAAPDDVPLMGGFEDYRNVIGGILGVAGIHGFLGNVEEFCAVANPEREKWRLFYRTWFGTFGHDPRPSKDLLPYAQSAAIFLKGTNDAGQARSLSTAINRRIGTIFSSMRAVRGPVIDNTLTFRLEQVGSGAPEAYSLDHGDF